MTRRLLGFPSAESCGFKSQKKPFQIRILVENAFIWCLICCSQPTFDPNVTKAGQHGGGWPELEPGVAFESSGAFGKTALKVWDRLKYVASEVGLDNYVIAGNPCTWSAFTFEQMVPQKVSWVIMRQNANAIIQGVLTRLPYAMLLQLLCSSTLPCC